MNPLNHMNPIEQNLCNKADLAKLPIAGNIELLPLCNMDCKMCFAKMTRAQMEAHAPMHDYKEWLEIAKQMSQAGTIFLLLTGGEPFLYPNFKELYIELKKLGFIVSINSNGTLINEEIANYLEQDKPRRINITLYGASNETYAKLCNNQKGFTQVMNAIKLLKERDIDIKFNCSLTPLNIHEIDKIHQISVDLDIPIDMGFYMFPPVRTNNVGNEKYRLDAKDAAWARFRMEQLSYGDEYKNLVRYTLDNYRNYKQTEPYKKGYTCRSGNSVYWINYDGTMSACSFTTDFEMNVFEEGFSKTWGKLLDHVGNSQLSKVCHNCDKRPLCGRCAAAAMSETGDISGVPKYYCELTSHYIELLEEYERNNIL